MLYRAPPTVTLYLASVWTDTNNCSAEPTEYHFLFRICELELNNTDALTVLLLQCQCNNIQQLSDTSSEHNRCSFVVLTKEGL